MTYTWVEHTAEVELAFDAFTQREVYEDACKALCELIAPEKRGSSKARTIAVEGTDDATLLAAFMDELVYLAEIDGFVCERLDDLALEPQKLTATVAGHIGEPRQLVKAVTYHRLRFERQGERFVANIVLDV